MLMKRITCIPTTLRVSITVDTTVDVTNASVVTPGLNHTPGSGPRTWPRPVGQCLSCPREHAQRYRGRWKGRTWILGQLGTESSSQSGEIGDVYQRRVRDINLAQQCICIARKSVSFILYCQYRHHRREGGLRAPRERHTESYPSD